MIKAKTLAAVCLAALTTAAACSSSSNSPGDSASPAAGAGKDVEVEASRALAPHLIDNPTLTLAPLTSRPPAGKTISLITCPLPSCQGIEQGVRDAASALDWKLKVINGGLTPDTYTSAIGAAVQDPGDGLLAPGILPNSAIQPQLEALQEKGVPFVGLYSVSPVGNGMVANIGSPLLVEKSGRILADWVTADSGGRGKSVVVYDKSYPQSQTAADGYTAEIEAVCPECVTRELPSNFATGIGKSVPGEVVSFLQRNPDTQYVVVQLGNATAGVGAAVAAAGLGGKVKIISRYADQANLANIKEGTETMGLTEETYEAGWRGVDAIARAITGTKADPTPIGVQHVITQDNLPDDISKPYTVPDFQAAFLSAWHSGR